METVGSFEAKTHLPQLLERVANGEEFTITKHGKPVRGLYPSLSLHPSPMCGRLSKNSKPSVRATIWAMASPSAT